MANSQRLALPKNLRFCTLAERTRSDCSASDFANIVADRFASLSDLDLPADDESPRVLGLSHEAEGLYRHWFDALNERREDTEPGPFRSFLAKAEELPGRLGLILALGRSENPATVDAVDGDTMLRSATLADWFVSEAERVLAMFSETEEQRAVRELVEYIAGRDGRITIRELQRGPRRYRGKGAAERAERDLRNLVNAGIARTEVSRTASTGPMVETFILTPGDGDMFSRNLEEIANLSPSPPQEVQENTPIAAEGVEVRGVIPELETPEHPPGDGDSFRLGYKYLLDQVELNGQDEDLPARILTSFSSNLKLPQANDIISLRYHWLRQIPISFTWELLQKLKNVLLYWAWLGVLNKRRAGKVGSDSTPVSTARS